MQITVRSEEWMKQKTPTITTEDGKVHLQYHPRWRELRAEMVSSTVHYNIGDPAEANYWVIITLWNKRALIKRFATGSSSVQHRVRAMNAIKAKYEAGIYSGDLVVMKSHQARQKHSWPIVFKSGILHALINQIDWIEPAAERDGILGSHSQAPTFRAWAKRNHKAPPNMGRHDIAKINHRLHIIYLLRQLGRRKWNHYLKVFQRRFTYLTYNKGKADVWTRQHGNKKVVHNLWHSDETPAENEAILEYHRAMERMARTLDMAREEWTRYGYSDAGAHDDEN